MSKLMQDLIEEYVEAIKKIYGSHVRQIILLMQGVTSVRILMWILCFWWICLTWN